MLNLVVPRSRREKYSPEPLSVMCVYLKAYISALEKYRPSAGEDL